jgi:hypothetical protein
MLEDREDFFVRKTIRIFRFKLTTTDKVINISIRNNANYRIDDSANLIGTFTTRVDKMSLMIQMKMNTKLYSILTKLFL